MLILVPIGPTAEAGDCHNLNMNDKEKRYVKPYLKTAKLRTSCARKETWCGFLLFP